MRIFELVTEDLAPAPGATAQGGTLDTSNQMVAQDPAAQQRQMQAQIAQRQKEVQEKKKQIQDQITDLTKQITDLKQQMVELK